MVPTQNPLPPVPTTKILAISHFMGTPMTPAQRAQIMPHEVHDTVNAYLAGKIDQWYFGLCVAMDTVAQFPKVPKEARGWYALTL